MKQKAWNVYAPQNEPPYHGTTYHLIDTVFYDADLDAKYVQDSLINHDGYHPGIFVEPKL